jgi:DNA topoisomerase-1
VDLKFTARMEEELDSVEKGQKNWRSLLQEFLTAGLKIPLRTPKKRWTGERNKVPDEVSDDDLRRVRRQMVVKSGPVTAVPCLPRLSECIAYKALDIEMPGRCPPLRQAHTEATSRNGLHLLCVRKAEGVAASITWDVPVKDDCPECGWTMFKRSRPRLSEALLHQSRLPQLHPEDKRGYRRTAARTEGRRTLAPAAGSAEKEESAPAKKTSSKRASSKTAAAKKTTGTAAKTASRTAGKKKATSSAAKKTTRTASRAKKSAEDGGTSEKK